MDVLAPRPGPRLVSAALALLTLGAHATPVDAQAGCPAPSFAIQVSADPFEPGSTAPVVADFTGDGILDVLVAGGAFVAPKAELTLLAGLPPMGGLPVWDAPRDFPIRWRVGGTLGADVDSDGWLDAIVWHFRLADTIGGPTTSPALVTLLLNDRAGGFLPATTIVEGGFEGSPLLADVDLDGVEDLVLREIDRQEIWTLRGDGTGGFERAQRTGFTGQFDGPARLEALAHMDGDAFPDLVVTSGGVVHVMRGNGDGTFTPDSMGPIRRGDVAVADFDGNGTVDVLAFAPLEDEVHVHPGDGAGGLGPGIITKTPDRPSNPIVLDFNLDGIPDIVFASRTTPSRFTMLGNGDGTFGAAMPLPSSLGFAATVADLLEDGRPDIVTAAGLRLVAFVNTCTAPPIAPRFVSPTPTDVAVELGRPIAYNVRVLDPTGVERRRIDLSVLGAPLAGAHSPELGALHTLAGGTVHVRFEAAAIAPDDGVRFLRYTATASGGAGAMAAVRVAWIARAFALWGRPLR